MNNPPEPREHWFFQGSLYVGGERQEEWQEDDESFPVAQRQEKEETFAETSTVHQTHPLRFPRQIVTHVSVVYVYHYNEISCYICADISLYVLSASNRYKRVRFVGKVSPFLNVVFCNFLNVVFCNFFNNFNKFI